MSSLTEQIAELSARDQRLTRLICRLVDGHDALVAGKNQEIERLRHDIGELKIEVGRLELLRDTLAKHAQQEQNRAIAAEAVIARSRTALAALDRRGVNNFDLPTVADVKDAWRQSLGQPDKPHNAPTEPATTPPARIILIGPDGPREDP